MLFVVLRQHVGAVTEVNHEHTVRRLMFEPGTEVAERWVTNTALFKLRYEAWQPEQLALQVCQNCPLCNLV